MEDALWKLGSLLLASVLLFLIPTQAMLERQDDVTRALVQAEVVRFTDTARDMGSISPQLHDRFVSRLEATGLLYDVQIRHEKRTWIPVYEQSPSGLLFADRYEMSRVTAGEGDVLAVLYPEIGDPSWEACRYLMNPGDLLFVEVRSRGVTMAGVLRGWLFSGSAPGILARAGGMVRNEAH